MMARELTPGFVCMNDVTLKAKLVDSEQLLAQVFDDGCKPTVRWLRNQMKAKVIPHFRIGHLVFFDVDMVRSALVAKNMIRGRMVLRSAPVN